MIDADPFKFDHGLEYAVQIIRHGQTQWETVMDWVTHETAIANCRKLSQDDFMWKIRCIRKSRYPPWPVCSVHYFRENER